MSAAVEGPAPRRTRLYANYCRISAAKARCAITRARPPHIASCRWLRAAYLTNGKMLMSPYDRAYATPYDSLCDLISLAANASGKNAKR
jgi:hypothetical protein